MSVPFLSGSIRRVSLKAHYSGTSVVTWCNTAPIKIYGGKYALITTDLSFAMERDIYSYKQKSPCRNWGVREFQTAMVMSGLIRMDATRITGLTRLSFSQ